jgi:hypothetical protein
MRHLFNSLLSGTRSSPFSLSSLWPWMLILIRRFFCTDSRILVTHEDATVDFWWDLHSLHEVIGTIDNTLHEHSCLEIYRFDFHCCDIETSLRTCLLVFMQPRRVGLNLAPKRSMEVQLSMRHLRLQVEKIMGSNKAMDLMKNMVSLLSLTC